MVPAAAGPYGFLFRRRALWPTLAAFTLSACTDSSKEPATVDISPANPSVMEGDAVTVSTGNVGSGWGWSIDDPSVATVTATTPGTAVVSGVRAGTTTLRVLVSNAYGSGVSTTASTTVTVTPAAITKVTVAPTTSTVPAGGAVQLTATASGSAGQAIDITQGKHGPITWFSTNADFDVDANGLVTAATNTPPSSSATIQATVQGVIGSATVATRAADTLAISAAPASVAITQGGSALVAVVIDRTKYGQAVTFTVSGLPAGVTGVFSVNPAPAGSPGPNLSLAASATAVAGEYTVTVTGTGAGVPAASATFDLVVSPSTGFVFSLTPPGVQVAAGGSSSTTIHVFRGNVFTPITFTSASPDGITGTFTPNPETNTVTTTVFAFTVPAAVTPGIHLVTITGTATGVTPQSQFLTVLVLGPGRTLLVTDHSGGTLTGAFVNGLPLVPLGGVFSVPTPGLFVTFNAVAGVTYSTALDLAPAAYSDQTFQRVSDKLSVTQPQGTLSFELDNYLLSTYGIAITGLGTQAQLFTSGMATTQGFLTQVTLGDPLLAAVLRSSAGLTNTNVTGLYGATLPANFSVVDLSTAVAPVQVPTIVNGAGSGSGILALDLQSTQGEFADHISVQKPQVGAFTGNTQTTVPLFPTVPVGTVQELTATVTPPFGANPQLGVLAFYDVAPASVTLQLGPLSTQLPTVTKLANAAFSQFQVTIPFEPAYNGGYAIEIYGSSGGRAVFTGLVTPAQINGGIYVFTVPNIPAMAQVLPPGQLYTIIVTRMGGYANQQSIFMPLPVAGTTVIFDRTSITTM